MQWSTSCLNWKERIVNKHSLIPFSPLFQHEAEAGLSVFNSLKVVDVAGSPQIVKISKPWVQDFMSAIFGSYDPDSGKRLISEIMLLISKKNSKSTIAGLLMLTLLIRNWRQSAEFLILSPTKEIADNSFKPIKDAIKADEELEVLFQVQDHIRTITHRSTNAQLKVVAADSDRVGGKKAVVILIDELWLFGKKHNAESMFREATGGLASSWEDLYQDIAASVEPLSTREYVSSESFQSKVVARIVIRYKDYITPSMRIVHRGDVYNIAGTLADKNSGLEYLTIPVSKGVNDG